MVTISQLYSSVNSIPDKKTSINRFVEFFENNLVIVDTLLTFQKHRRRVNEGNCGYTGQNLSYACKACRIRVTVAN